MKRERSSSMSIVEPKQFVGGVEGVGVDGE